MKAFAIDAAIALGVMALVTLAAQLLGAANLGTALAIGSLGFVAALVYVIARR